jgi:transcriptional regulator with XRE-family HTH domain
MEFLSVASSAPRAADALGRTIARLRRRAGKTQAALATALGITPEQLSEMEAGTREIHLDDIDHLSAALGVAPHELFGA